MGCLGCCFTSWKPLWLAVPLLGFCSHPLGSFCPLGPSGCAWLLLPAQIPHLPGCVCEWASAGSSHCTQPDVPAVVGQAASGASTGASSVQGCSWTRRTANSFCCGYQHVHKGNAIIPESSETPGTTKPQRRSYSMSQPWLGEPWGLGSQKVFSPSCHPQCGEQGACFIPVCVTALSVPPLSRSWVLVPCPGRMRHMGNWRVSKMERSFIEWQNSSEETRSE